MFGVVLWFSCWLASWFRLHGLGKRTDNPVIRGGNYRGLTNAWSLLLRGRWPELKGLWLDRAISWQCRLPLAHP